MRKKTDEELEELERIRDQIAKNIFDRGINEGYGLDIIINDENDEED